MTSVTIFRQGGVKMGGKAHNEQSPKDRDKQLRKKTPNHSSKTAIHARATVCIQPRNAKEAMHTQVEVKSVTKPPCRK